ncbi:GNAT family N-acetyltransferase [Pelagibacterium sp.]|uniref:GNAT family N-acetyltransferase n=1 Tax=Pelagibacterium sp. TaxID=1967288 RepID=UPI003A8EA428
MTATPPLLNTDRLVLRAPVMADFEAYSALMQSDRAVHMGGPFDIEGAWHAFCHDAAQWLLLGHGALMIEAEGRAVGQVAVNAGPLFPEHELGWLVYEGAEGKGYAQEAALCLKCWARDTLGLRTLVSYVDRDNYRSRSLAERLGAVLDADAARPHPDDLVYRHW